MITLHIPGMQILTRDGLHHFGDVDIILEVIFKDTYGMRILGKCMAPPKVLMDIGGHIGCWGIVAKHMWPEAALYAFEPNPESSDLYSLNMRLNKHNKVVVHNLAVTGNGARSCMAIEENPIVTGGFRLVTEDELEGLNDPQSEYQQYVGGQKVDISHTNVKCISLEEVLDLHHLEHVDLLKMDCEGSEIEILEMMPERVAKKIDMVLGEYHCEGGWDRFEPLFRSKFGHLSLHPIERAARYIGEFIAAPPDVMQRVLTMAYGAKQGDNP